MFGVIMVVFKVSHCKIGFIRYVAVATLGVVRFLIGLDWNCDVT